ncbi:hypothetical protein ACSTS3_14490 [Aquimarina muelleri]|uniref:hypothetical protein n=1 Tax=Aquimarina muelleri TaxID=279356 RepID=UPI003F683C51
MKKNTKKQAIEKKYKQGLIPDHLYEEINRDIETYLEKKFEKNENLIEEMILFRENKGLDIFFSEQYIIKKLASIF